MKHSVNSYSAEKIPLCCQKGLTQNLLDVDHARWSQYLDTVTNEMVVSLDTYMAGIVSERIVIDRQWPADWWQAFRERWFPGWWLARRPVQYERIHVDKKIFSAVCPHVPITSPGQVTRHLEWMALTHDGVDGPTPLGGTEEI